jgi:hypothetical protein
MNRFARARIVLGTLALVACSGAPGPGAAGSNTAQIGLGSVAAARDFAGALPDSTRAVAALPFSDSVRQRFFFVPDVSIPGGRQGLVLSRMSPPQRDAAWRLLATGLSESGYRTARAIAENETLLKGIEAAAGVSDRNQRDPLRYYVSVFGTPSPAQPWGWRFEGHHLSVNVTHAGSEVVVAPLFMGANPHRVPSGPTAGSRLLAREEDLARALVTMLDDAQRAKAIVSPNAYNEIRTGNDPAARALPTDGLAASEMTAPQRATLRELLAVYVDRETPSAARALMERIDRAGFEKLRFVWAGSTEPGKQHYYRIHGPTVLVEYDNAQGSGNHSHTILRDLENDFGGDLLRRHRQQTMH